MARLHAALVSLQLRRSRQRGHVRPMDPSPVGPATTGTPVRQGQEGTSLALVARDDGCATSIARHGRGQRPTARLRQPAQSAADSRWHCLDPAKTCGSCGSGSPRACAKADYTSCAAAQLCCGASPIRHRHHRHSRLSRPSTTGRYVATNLQMKRDALDTFWKHSEIEPARTKPWKPKAGLLSFLQSL